MRYLNTSARCIIIFICVLANLQSVVGDPLKILNFTYRTKQFEILELTIANNIITLEVDQDLYHKVQCPIEFSEVTQTQFVPCCNKSTNATGPCYTPIYADEKCIDENHATSTGIMQADETSLKRYSFKVANYQNCHSISILAKAVSGNIILINVKLGNAPKFSRSNWLIRLGQTFLGISIRNERVYMSANDFLRAEYGSNGISLCCSKIREVNPGWSGEMRIGWKPFITTRYEFSVTSKCIPIWPVANSI